MDPHPDLDPDPSFYQMPITKKYFTSLHRITVLNKCVDTDPDLELEPKEILTDPDPRGLICYGSDRSGSRNKGHLSWLGLFLLGNG